jgi:hypothetical protein
MDSFVALLGSVWYLVLARDADGAKHQTCPRDKSPTVVLLLTVNCRVCVEDHDGTDSSNEHQVPDHRLRLSSASLTYRRPCTGRFTLLIRLLSGADEMGIPPRPKISSQENFWAAVRWCQRPE